MTVCPVNLYWGKRSYQGILSTENELAIIRQACLGNKNALATLYQTHKVAIYTYIFYRVDGDSAVADDLTAEVFGRMLAKIQTFNPNGKPLIAWLYTIARNLIADHFRNLQQEQRKNSYSNGLNGHYDPERSAQNWRFPIGSHSQGEWLVRP